MQPEGGGLPEGGVLQQIEKDFGSFSNFREEFVRSALQLLGSGWVWLILKRNEKKLSVVHTRNAISPLAFGDIPIISLDLLEHAYYLDYKDDRLTYVTNFMDHLISWDTVTLRMMRAESFVYLGEPNIPLACDTDHLVIRYPVNKSCWKKQRVAKDCIRDAYLPTAIYMVNLKISCWFCNISLGYCYKEVGILHHFPWLLLQRKSVSSFKTCNKAVLDNWEHVDYVVGLNAQHPWALKP